MSASRTLAIAFAAAVALVLAVASAAGIDTLSAPPVPHRVVLMGTLTVLVLILLVRARRLPPDPRPAIPLPAAPAALAGAAFAAALFVAIVPLQSFPYSGDEGAYVLQAQMLAAGQVSIDLTPVQPYLEIFYIFPWQGRLISQYPPGWPAILAAFESLRLPLVLAGPLLGAVSVLALWRLGAERHGPAAGMLAAALMAVSSFWLFNAASYYNHTAVGLFAILFVLGVTRFIDRPTLGAALLTGIAFSAVAATRHFDAALLALPAAIAILRQARARHWALLPLAAAAALPAIALTLWYYRAATGQWLAIPQALRDPNDGLLTAYWSLATANATLAARFLEFAEWVSPAFVLLLVAALAGKWRARTLRFHDLYAPVFLVGYWLFWSDGIYGWGPRYIYAAFPFMALTIAGWAATTARQDLPPIRLLLAAALLSAALQIVPIAIRSAEMVSGTRELYTAVARAGLRNAVVMIGTWTGKVRLTPPGDLARNGLRLDGDVIYAHAPGVRIERTRPPDLEASAAAMQAYLPGREIWLYVRNPGDTVGHLEKWK